MDTFAELIAAVQSDLTIDSNSSLYPLATVKLAINRAYRKAGGLFDWPETQDAKKTSTVSGQEYYDYPQNWRPNSVWKIEVDGEDYGDPLNFADFLYEKDNDWPSGADVAHTSQWRRFFLYPIPSSNGNNNISIWGYKVVDVLTNNGDVTIFSYSMPECNDAIVMEAVAILKDKGEEENKSQFRSAKALQILSVAWNRIKRSLAKYEKTRPLFNIPDFFDKNFGNSTDVTGNF